MSPYFSHHPTLSIDGPTETTIWSSSFTLPSDTSLLTFNNTVPVIPIGLPISQVRTREMLSELGLLLALDAANIFDCCLVPMVQSIVKYVLCIHCVRIIIH
jgi:non-ribosomal peptide synthetase component F